MMHLTFSDKDLVLGDEAAELVVAYAAALARTQSADTVKIHAYGSDGDKVEAMLLLDVGAPVMVETSHSDLPEPDNSEIERYMRGRLAQLSSPTQAMPIDADDSGVIDDFETAGDDGPGGV